MICGFFGPQLFQVKNIQALVNSGENYRILSLIGSIPRREKFCVVMALKGHNGDSFQIT